MVVRKYFFILFNIDKIFLVDFDVVVSDIFIGVEVCLM